MIPITTALQNLKATRKWHRAEVCRITLVDDPTPIRMTTADYVVTGPSSEKFMPGYPLLSRKDIVREAGLTAQSLELNLAARTSDLLYNRSWMTCVRDGIFDGAKVEYLFAYSAFATPGDCATVGFELQFTGVVADCFPQAGAIIMRCEDPLRALDTQHPVALFMNQCANTLYDARCTLLKASSTSSEVVGSGATITTIPWTSAVTPHSIYDLGQIRFTSGLCKGIRRVVRSWDGTTITLASALPRVPTAGDTFDLSRGCTKTQAACASFANLANFRGFPEVPKAETVI